FVVLCLVVHTVSSPASTVYTFPTRRAGEIAGQVAAHHRESDDADLGGRFGGGGHGRVPFASCGWVVTSPRLRRGSVFDGARCACLRAPLSHRPAPYLPPGNAVRAAMAMACRMLQSSAFRRLRGKVIVCGTSLRT